MGQHVSSQSSMKTQRGGAGLALRARRRASTAVQSSARTAANAARCFAKAVRCGTGTGYAMTGARKGGEGEGERVWERGKAVEGRKSGGGSKGDREKERVRERERDLYGMNETEGIRI